jgi:hypothetical protein
MRLQLKQLASHSGEIKELSSAILDAPAEKIIIEKPPIKIRKSSENTNARNVSFDEKSSIIVIRDKEKLEVQTIDWKDARDPKQHDYVQLYPQTRDSRGRIRCARAILCNDAIIKDDDAPAADDNHHSLLPLLFRTLSVSKIMEHAKISYREPTEELELFKQEGLRQLQLYFSREQNISPEPSGQATSADTSVSNGPSGLKMPNVSISSTEKGHTLSDISQANSDELDMTTSPVNSSFSSAMASSPPAKRRQESSQPSDFGDTQPSMKKARQECWGDQRRKTGKFLVWN